MVYYIRRDISGQPPLSVEHEGPPPCLYCGEPVTRPSMDGPLVCGPCDMDGGTIRTVRDGKVVLLSGTPRISEWHRAHFKHCIDSIIATGRYPADAGPTWRPKEESK